MDIIDEIKANELKPIGHAKELVCFNIDKNTNWLLYKYTYENNITKSALIRYLVNDFLSKEIRQ